MHDPATPVRDIQIVESASAEERPRRHKRTVAAAVCGLVIVLALGALNLKAPLGGDQALFMVAAKAINSGKTLYLDFWDVKQPGIFWYYWVAGRLFGFNGLGVHAFELLWMLALALALIVAHRKVRLFAWGSLLAAAVPVGTYYIIASTNHLTQVEGVVGLPLFICVWMCADAARSDKSRFAKLLVAGLAAGIVLLFKLIFLPLVGTIWAASFGYYLAERRPSPIRALGRFVAPVLIGMVLPLAATLAYFRHAGCLSEFLYTSFILPPHIVKEMPWGGIVDFANPLHWYDLNFAVMLAAGVFGGYLAFRRRRDPLIMNLAVWWAAAVIVNIIQRTSWWQYHEMLMVVPTGLLAVIGFEEIAYGLKKARPFGEVPRALVVVSFIALFSPFLFRVGGKAIEVARDYRHPSATTKPLVMGNSRNVYAKEWAETEFLRQPESRQGDIFIFGHPYMYLASGRGQAVAPNGWIPEYFLRPQWETLLRELEEKRPPYIFVETSDEPVIDQRAPEVRAFIGANYRELKRSAMGVWYEVQKEPRD